VVTAVEKAYGVKFTTSEVLGMSSLGKIREVLRQKGKDVPPQPSPGG
jgi:hypothetical protein